MYYIYPNLTEIIHTCNRGCFITLPRPVIKISQSSQMYVFNRYFHLLLLFSKIGRVWCQPGKNHSIYHWHYAPNHCNFDTVLQFTSVCHWRTKVPIAHINNSNHNLSCYAMLLLFSCTKLCGMTFAPFPLTIQSQQISCIYFQTCLQIDIQIMQMLAFCFALV